MSDQAQWSEYVPPEEEQVPPPEARPLFSIPRPEVNHDAELLRHNYLCRGGGLLLPAPTGIGKSSFIMQAAVSWSLGRSHFGIMPARPLACLIIQAENDDSDIAEMRDGISAGLGLTSEEVDSLRDSLPIVHEETRTGQRFFSEVVRPLLEKYRPDMLIIDPVLSYLGGSASEQRDVSPWLRNWLNPLLREFNCGGILIHHTNKPAKGREKPDWQAGDFAYLGAGSAEWANWARAVLSIAAVGSHSVFRLHAAKRGTRLRWVGSDGGVSYERTIAHARESGRIFWRDAAPEEIPTNGRPRAYDLQPLVDLLPKDGLKTGEWLREAKTECGVSDRKFYDMTKTLRETGRVFKSVVTGKWTRK